MPKRGYKPKIAYFCTFKFLTVNETYRIVPSPVLRSVPGLFASDVFGRPDGRPGRWHRGPAAGYRLRYRFGRVARKGNHHGRGRGVRRLAAGRKPGTDRRPYGCLHRHRLRRRPAIRRNRAAGCDVHGRRAAGRDGVVQTRRRHPVHSLSRRGGVHSRHRPDDFHDADRRPVRDEFRRGTRAGDFIGKWMLYFRHFGSVNWANLAVGWAASC